MPDNGPQPSTSKQVTAPGQPSLNISNSSLQNTTLMLQSGDATISHLQTHADSNNPSSVNPAPSHKEKIVYALVSRKLDEIKDELSNFVKSKDQTNLTEELKNASKDVFNLMKDIDASLDETVLGKMKEVIKLLCGCKKTINFEVTLRLIKSALILIRKIIRPEARIQELLDFAKLILDERRKSNTPKMNEDEFHQWWILMKKIIKLIKKVDIEPTKTKAIPAANLSVDCGEWFVAKNDHPKAIEILERAIDALDLSCGENNKSYFMYTKCCLILTDAYFQSQQLNEANKWFKKTEKAFKQVVNFPEDKEEMAKFYELLLTLRREF